MLMKRPRGTQERAPGLLVGPGREGGVSRLARGSACGSGESTAGAGSRACAGRGGTARDGLEGESGELGMAYTAPETPWSESKSQGSYSGESGEVWRAQNHSESGFEGIGLAGELRMR